MGVDKKIIWYYIKNIKIKCLENTKKQKDKKDKVKKNVKNKPGKKCKIYTK